MVNLLVVIIICNEMIKCFVHIRFIDIIKAIFNAIYLKSYFPKLWKVGYIILIFKSDDFLDPSNYRGIPVDPRQQPEMQELIVLCHTHTIGEVPTMKIISDKRASVLRQIFRQMFVTAIPMTSSSRDIYFQTPSGNQTKL